MISQEHILFYPRGGLGNQLFQYAAATHLSHKLNLPIVADTVLLASGARFNNGLARRVLELDKFKNEINFIDSGNALRAPIKSRYLTLQRLIGDKFPSLLLSQNVFANEKNDHIKHFNRISKHVKINSYCSSPEYFPDCGKMVSNQITQILKPSNWLTNLQKNIKQDDPIAINFRLGDYKNLTNIYGKPDLEYYIKSINLLKDLMGDRPIWIFSDEPHEALEFSKEKINVDNVVFHDNEQKPIEYLNALATCRAIVCANSSFSWWGAFLSSNLNIDSKIIFPRPMFDDPSFQEPFNWLPINWITMGRKVNF